MHNVFHERFFSERRGWHDLGPQITRPMLAQEAWSTLSPYIVSLEDLVCRTMPDLPITHRGIIRHPVPDDPEFRTFGVVGLEYVLIDPQRFCEIFDEAVHVNIATMGALGKGETFFISVPLPGFDVNGDPVENYMIVISPYVGNAAYEVIVSGIRPVCQNTLRAARRQSTESYRIVHDIHSEDRLRLWMSGMYQRAESRTATLKEFFGILANYRPTVDETETILSSVYPDPKDPRYSPNAPEEEIERRLPEFEKSLESIRRTRSAVRELFQGRGTGLDSPQIAGTGWALYNGFTEWESWRRTTNPMARSENLLVGDRAQTIGRAYSVILDAALR